MISEIEDGISIWKSKELDELVPFMLERWIESTESVIRDFDGGDRQRIRKSAHSVKTMLNTMKLTAISENMSRIELDEFGEQELAKAQEALLLLKAEMLKHLNVES